MDGLGQQEGAPAVEGREKEDERKRESEGEEQVGGEVREEREMEGGSLIPRLSPLAHVYDH